MTHPSSPTETKRTTAQIIDDFKTGSFNCLLSTSVGEEGLDIGSVGLIVMYDAVSSITRLVQRMGRTGRKSDGKVGTL